MSFNDPASLTVNTTTVVTLVPEVDFFSWPAISGEKYPPTLGTGWVYGMADGLTCVQITTFGTNTTVAWPNIPLVSPKKSSFTGYTATHKFRSTGSTNNGTGWWYTLTFPGNIQLQLNIGSSTPSVCSITAAIAGSVLPGGSQCPCPNFNDSNFHKFSVVVSGALTVHGAAFSVYMDDALIPSTLGASSYSGVTLIPDSGQFAVNRNTAAGQTLTQYAAGPYLQYS